VGGIKRLVDGYLKFRKEAFPEMKDHFHLLAELQTPETLFVTCSDSRVVPNLILQAEPGELFISRHIGNVVPPAGEVAGAVSATIEYAVLVLEVKHIIICGHSDCGAIKAVMEKTKLRGLPLAERWLQYVESAWKFRDPSEPVGDDAARLRALIRANVIAQVRNTRTHPEVAAAVAAGRLAVHGWYYDILSGAIDAYDERSRRFVPLEEMVERG
jgi:carbonic anhydrase